MEKERNNKQLKEGRIDIVNLIDGAITELSIHQKRVKMTHFRPEMAYS
jgi:hypothetical protein